MLYVLFKKILFYLWLCLVFIATHRLFSGCSERGLLFVAVHGLLTVVASLVVEYGLQVRGLQ